MQEDTAVNPEKGNRKRTGLVRKAVIVLGFAARIVVCITVMTVMLAEDRWERHWEYGKYVDIYP